MPDQEEYALRSLPQSSAWYRRLATVCAAVALICVLAMVGAAEGLGQPDLVTRTGTLTVIWGDGENGTPIPPQYFLTTAEGLTFTLEPGQTSDADLMALHMREVEVSGRLPASSAPQAASGAGIVLQVDRVRLLDTSRSAASPAVSGNSRWLSVACKFADEPDEPRSVSYLSAMYGATSPGLDHYWRAASYDQLNVAGSTAVGWYILPQPRAHYLINDKEIRFGELLTDCAGQAEGDVHVPDFDGINLVFNGSLGCCAFGGATSANIGGVQKVYRTTWLPPWGYARISVVQHEMGHGFGMPHSAANGLIYANAWDVMSDTTNYCAFQDPDYGCAGKFTIAYHRDRVGWLPAGRKYVAGPGMHQITLEQTELPGPDGYLLAQVPVNGSATHFITIEARRRVSYDAGLPGAAVILHDVVTTRTEPAHLIDLSQSLGGAGEWVMWRPGETYASTVGNILIRIDAATATGYEITIINGAVAGTVELSPSDDTFVRQDEPATAFGNSPELRVRKAGPHDETFLKFDPALFPGIPYRFRLQLTVREGQTASYGSLLQAPLTYEDKSGPWTEAALTWANRPLFASTYGSFASSPSRQGDLVQWDITGAAYRFERGIDVILLRPSSTTDIVYGSKEGGDGPRLVIDYLLAQAAPTPTPGPTYTPTPTATTAPSSTPTSTLAPTVKPTKTTTPTPQPTKTRKPTRTPKPTKTPLPTATAPSSATPTLTGTPSPTPTFGASVTPVITSTPTVRPTVGPSPTPTIGPSPTSTVRPSPTPTSRPPAFSVRLPVVFR